jgi:hypothetical protein
MMIAFQINTLAGYFLKYYSRQATINEINKLNISENQELITDNY